MNRLECRELTQARDDSLYSSLTMSSYPKHSPQPQMHEENREKDDFRVRECRRDVVHLVTERGFQSVLSFDAIFRFLRG